MSSDFTDGLFGSSCQAAPGGSVERLAVLGSSFLSTLFAVCFLHPLIIGIEFFAQVLSCQFVPELYSFSWIFLPC